MTASETLLRPNKLAHVVLKTNKYTEMVQFWTTIVGGRVVLGNDKLTFITYDDEHHRIAIANLPHAKENDSLTCGLAHIAFSFDDLDALALAYEQRKERGLHPFWCINHGTTTSMYYRDPDGNEAELQIDNFSDPEDATKYMTSKAFGENPFGVEFNPDDFVFRVRSGESFEDIKQRPDIGPRNTLLERTVPPSKRRATAALT
jgi:catechol-2,3-dioxygenase